MNEDLVMVHSNIGHTILNQRQIADLKKLVGKYEERCLITIDGKAIEKRIKEIIGEAGKP